MWPMLNPMQNILFGNPPAPSSGPDGAAMATSNPMGAIASTVQSGVNEDRRNAFNSSMGQIGALLMAAGMRQTSPQRAQTLAGIAPVLGNMPREVLNSSQARLVQQKSMELQAQSARREQAIQSALADPNVPPEVKGLLRVDPDKGFEYLAKLHQPIPKQEEWSHAVDPNTGQITLYDKYSGQTRPAGAGAAGSSVQTAEGAATGAPVAPEGLTGPSLRRYNEEQGKQVAERQAELIREGETSKSMLPQIKRMQEIWNRLTQLDAIGPVVGSDIGRTFERTIGARFSPAMKEAETLREEYDRLRERAKAAFAAATAKGAISDYEQRLFQTAQGGSLAAVSPDVGKHDLAMSLEEIQRKMRQADEARQGRFPSMTGGAATPAPPAQTAQPDLSLAKKAPDGHTYVPDPARPGKYLRVD